MSWLPFRTHYSSSELAYRQQARLKVVREALPLFYIVLFIILFGVMSLLCLKPWKELRDLERECNRAQILATQAQNRAAEAKRTADRLANDPEYRNYVKYYNNNLSLQNDFVYKIQKED
jgi:ABC-type dipeptide/oligopeptide/nickel transport system permease component